jgi:SAM-dependent methyltransferase
MRPAVVGPLAFLLLVALHVKLCAAVAGIGNDGTGQNTVWIASAVLQRFLHTETGRRFVEGRHCVELGCGMGTTSIAAVQLGAEQVVATDGTFATVKMARSNAERNLEPALLPRFTAQHYLWGESPPMGTFTFDTVFVADVIYEYEQVAPLVAGIQAVCGSVCDVLIAYDASRWQSGIDIVCYSLEQQGFAITHNYDTTVAGLHKATSEELQQYADNFQGPPEMIPGWGGSSVDGQHVEVALARLQTPQHLHHPGL